MAAPAGITLKNLDETTWTLNYSLTGDYDGVLKLQGVAYLMRCVMASTTLTVTTKQWEVEGITHLQHVNTLTAGLPGSTEKYVLDWEPNEFYDDLFGNVRDRSRWVKIEKLDEEYQKDGWEDGTSEIIQLFTDHLDVDVTTSQACGFEMIDGMRHHTRRLVVKKGDGEETIQLRMVFDHAGPVGEDENEGKHEEELEEKVD